MAATKRFVEAALSIFSSENVENILARPWLWHIHDQIIADTETFRSAVQAINTSEDMGAKGIIDLIEFYQKYIASLDSFSDEMVAAIRGYLDEAPDSRAGLLTHYETADHYNALDYKLIPPMSNKAIEKNVRRLKRLALGAEPSDVGRFSGTQKQLLRKGLYPASLHWPLHQLYSELNQLPGYEGRWVYNSHKSDRENLRALDFGVLIVDSCNSSPVEYNLRGVIDKKYILDHGYNLPASAGLSKKMVQKMKTIVNTTSASAPSAPITEAGTTVLTRETSVIFAFETFNLQKWRLLGHVDEVVPSRPVVLGGLAVGSKAESRAGGGQSLGPQRPRFYPDRSDQVAIAVRHLSPGSSMTEIRAESLIFPGIRVTLTAEDVSHVLTGPIDVVEKYQSYFEQKIVERCFDPSRGVIFDKYKTAVEKGADQTVKLKLRNELTSIFSAMSSMEECADYISGQSMQLLVQSRMEHLVPAPLFDKPSSPIYNKIELRLSFLAKISALGAELQKKLKSRETLNILSSKDEAAISTALNSVFETLERTDAWAGVENSLKDFYVLHKGVV